MRPVYFFIALFILGPLPISHGFTLNNNVAASFAQEEIAINMSSNTDCSATGLTNDEILSLAVEAAALYWNRVASSDVFLKRGELVSVGSSFETGNICTSGLNASCDPNESLKVSSDILIACNTTTSNFSNSSYVMAVALPNNIEGTTIQGALVLINSSGSTSTNVFGNKARSEQISILAHELGHALGLGHSAVKDSMMYFESIDKRPALGWDDIQGITYLYPQEQPFSCSTISTSSNPSLPQGLLALALLLLVTAPITKVLGLKGR